MASLPRGLSRADRAGRGPPTPTRRSTPTGSPAAGVLNFAISSSVKGRGRRSGPATGGRRWHVQGASPHSTHRTRHASISPRAKASKSGDQASRVTRNGRASRHACRAIGPGPSSSGGRLVGVFTFRRAGPADSGALSRLTRARAEWMTRRGLPGAAGRWALLRGVPLLWLAGVLARTSALDRGRALGCEPVHPLAESLVVAPQLDHRPEPDGRLDAVVHPGLRQRPVQLGL